MTRGSKRRWLGTVDPYARLRRIEALDLDTQFREITQLFYADFQSTMVAKSVSAFLMNYSAPRISSVLASSGELEDRLAKRVVDTIKLASTVMEQGLEGEGRDAARRVNHMHRQYDIHPDDFLGVGSEEVVGSIEMAERYGWRAVTDKEREALNRYYSLQTRAFGSPNPLPPTYAETKAFYEQFIDTQVRYAPQNERLGKVLVDWLAKMVPAPLRPIYRIVLLAQLDDRIALACGIKPASRPTKWFSHTVLKLIGRKDPIADGAPNHLDALVRTIYPDGHEIGKLGTQLPGECAMNVPPS